jgi:hypothetical protein
VAAALVLGASIFLARPAAGRGAPATAAIRYVAPPECPGAPAFFDLLVERTAGAWSFKSGGASPDLIVEIRDGSSGKIGRVQQTARAGGGAREIAAPDCRELVRALVLTTALSLEEPTASPPAPSAGVAATASPVPPTQSSTWFAGAGLETTFLFPSQPMPEGALFIERGRRSWPTGLDLGRPDFRLAIAHARNDLFTSERARFALSVATLTICPASVGLGSTAGLRLCAAGELGVLSGEGVLVGTPQSTRFLWSAAGAVLRFRWSPGRRVTLEAQAGVAAPFERTTFVFEMPRVEVAKVPAVVASGGLSIGLAIP